MKSENIIDETSKYLADITKKLDVLSTDEVEQDSFKAIALLWDELPAVTGNQEATAPRASKASRGGLCEAGVQLHVGPAVICGECGQVLSDRQDESFVGELF